MTLLTAELGAPAGSLEAPGLAVAGLSAVAKVGRREVQLLEDVDLTVGRGRCTAVIGESGSGKSTLLRAILRTAGQNVAVTGSVAVEGRELSGLSDRDFAELRGGQIALVAQNALAALDPMYRVGGQIAYLAGRHGGMTHEEADRRALDLLAQVGIVEPERVARSLPHELSGGMRQRCVLAMALACRPRVLLADEPTTALDVITQGRALALLAGIQRELGMSLLFVTHDIGVAATIADDVVVLYGGRVVEHGPVVEVLTRPVHPYTRGLVAANQPPAAGERWKAIGGEPPRAGVPIAGCGFAIRCSEVMAACLTSRPPHVQVGAASVDCFARAPG